MPPPNHMPSTAGTNQCWTLVRRNGGANCGAPEGHAVGVLMQSILYCVPRAPRRTSDKTHGVPSGHGLGKGGRLPIVA